MAGSVILPSLTNQMILAAFKDLVYAELKKRIVGNLEFGFGMQEGVIRTLQRMFGVNQEVNAEAWNEGSTWLHLSERIVDEKLQLWTDILDQLNDDPDTHVDYEEMDNAISVAVEEFALKHPELLSDALKKNL